MTIGIIGANSSVGTELCVLLRNAGLRVIPVVRSTLASAPLEAHGFDCRVADITQKSDARDTLADMNTVVIAAYAPPLPPHGRPRQARKVNEALVKHAVEFSAKESEIIYLSSVMAFGDDIYPDYENTIYPQEKQNLEEVTLKATNKTGKTGYALRLGHVNGPTQDWTRNIIDTIEKSEELVIQANSNKFSNIVHSVTIADAVAICHKEEPKSGKYTLVNQPQWSWRDVFEHYSEDTTIKFTNPTASSSTSIIEQVIDPLKNFIESHRTSFIPYMVFLPEKLNDEIIHRYRLEEINEEITSLNSDITFHMHHFDHKPAPGPTLPKLKETHNIIQQEEIIKDLFNLD